MMRWPNQTVQIEDAVLVLWLAVVEPLALRGVAAYENNAAWGWVLLLAVLAGAVVMLTRSPKEIEGEQSFLTVPPIYARLPMMAGMGLLAMSGFERLGFTRLGDYAFALVVGIFALSFMAYLHLPALPRLARRLLAAPLVVIGASQFSSIAADMFGDLDLQTFSEGLRTPGISFIAILLTLALLIQYALFVFGPRQTADGRGTWPQWLLRFLLYLIGLLTGRAIWPV